MEAVFSLFRTANKLPPPIDINDVVFNDGEGHLMFRGSRDRLFLPIPDARDLSEPSVFSQSTFSFVSLLVRNAWKLRNSQRIESLSDEDFVRFIFRYETVFKDDCVDYSYLSSPTFYMNETTPACGTKMFSDTQEQNLRCLKIELYPAGGTPFIVEPHDKLWQTAKWWGIHNALLHATWIQHVMLHRSLFPACFAFQQLPNDHVLFHLLGPHVKSTLAFHHNSYKIILDSGHPMCNHSLPFVARYQKIEELENETPVKNAWHIPDFVVTSENYPAADITPYKAAVWAFVRCFVEVHIDVLQGASTSGFLNAWRTCGLRYKPVAVGRDLPSTDDWVEMLTVVITNSSFGHSMQHNVGLSVIEDITKGCSFDYLPFRIRVAPPMHINDYGRVGEPLNWWIDRFQTAMFGSAAFVYPSPGSIYTDISYVALHGNEYIKSANDAMIDVCQKLDAEIAKVHKHWVVMSSIRN
jgi:hypothetical protein